MQDHYGNELKCPRGCNRGVHVAGTAGKGRGEIYACSYCYYRFYSEAEQSSGVPVSAAYEESLDRMRGGCE